MIMYLCKTINKHLKLKIMARFILDYDTNLTKNTKILITSFITPSMVSPNGDSAQYCLRDLIDILSSCGHEIPKVDTKLLNDLYHGESVNYIEICF